MQFPKLKVFQVSRKWLVVPLVVGALAVGLVVGAGATALAATALADGHRADGSSRNFAARVADKLTGALGLETAITESQVEDAFNAAHGDWQEEMLQARLDALAVAEGPAAAIMTWFSAYPYSDLIKLRPVGLVQSDRVSGVLERLVAREAISQAQADGIQAWYAERPELPAGLEQSRGHFRGRDGDGRRGGHHWGKGDGDGFRGGRHWGKDDGFGF